MGVSQSNRRGSRSPRAAATSISVVEVWPDGSTTDATDASTPHPGTGQESTVTAPETGAAGPNALTGAVTPYDPSEHTVEDVITYVDAHPGEADAILNAELAGKARKTLIAHLEG